MCVCVCVCVCEASLQNPQNVEKNFFFILLEIHNRDYRDIYLHIKSNPLSELFVKQSHFKVS